MFIDNLRGYLVLYLSCTLASSAGLGGGGLNVPIFLVLFNYEYKAAVICSLFSVLGNHLAQTSLNWNKSHPNMKSRSLIYWEVILIVLPAQLAGSNIGKLISLLSILCIISMIFLYIYIYIYIILFMLYLYHHTYINQPDIPLTLLLYYVMYMYT